MTVFFLVMGLLIPALMIFFGVLWKDHPPKEINALAGYRTAMSMLNQDTWRFAHHYFCRLCLLAGVPLFAVSVVVLAAIMIFGKGDAGALGGAIVPLVLIQTVFFVVPVYPTEKALRKTFDENGGRRV